MLIWDLNNRCFEKVKYEDNLAEIACARCNLMQAIEISISLGNMFFLEKCGK